MKTLQRQQCYNNSLCNSNNNYFDSKLGLRNHYLVEFVWAIGHSKSTESVVAPFKESGTITL